MLVYLFPFSLLLLVQQVSFVSPQLKGKLHRDPILTYQPLSAILAAAAILLLHRTSTLPLSIAFHHPQDLRNFAQSNKKCIQYWFRNTRTVGWCQNDPLSCEVTRWCVIHTQLSQMWRFRFENIKYKKVQT